MKQWMDGWWIVVSEGFFYVCCVTTLWHLWLALPFVSGYNWPGTVRYLVIALVMALCSWFAFDDWCYRTDYYVKTYPEDCEFDE